jgi:hypothetical protein
VAREKRRSAGIERSARVTDAVRGPLEVLGAMRRTPLSVAIPVLIPACAGIVLTFHVHTAPFGRLVSLAIATGLLIVPLAVSVVLLGRIGDGSRRNALWSLPLLTLLFIVGLCVLHHEGTLVELGLNGQQVRTVGSRRLYIVSLVLSSLMAWVVFSLCPVLLCYRLRRLTRVTGPSLVRVYSEMLKTLILEDNLAMLGCIAFMVFSCSVMLAFMSSSGQVGDTIAIASLLTYQATAVAQVSVKCIALTQGRFFSTIERTHERIIRELLTRISDHVVVVGFSSLGKRIVRDTAMSGRLSGTLGSNGGPSGYLPRARGRVEQEVVPTALISVESMADTADVARRGSGGQVDSTSTVEFSVIATDTVVVERNPAEFVATFRVSSDVTIGLADLSKLHPRHPSLVGQYVIAVVGDVKKGMALDMARMADARLVVCSIPEKEVADAIESRVGGGD